MHAEQGQYQTALAIFEDIHKIQEDNGYEISKAGTQGEIGRIKILLEVWKKGFG